MGNPKCDVGQRGVRDDRPPRRVVSEPKTIAVINSVQR